MAPRLRHIRHVKSKNKLYPHLNELGGEIKIPLQVGSIYNIHHHIWLGIHQEISGHNFLDGIGGQTVGAGKIHHSQPVAVVDYVTYLFLHRNPWPVSNVLASAGDIIKNGGLSGIGVARQGNGNGFLVHAYSCSSFSIII